MKKLLIILPLIFIILIIFFYSVSFFKMTPTIDDKYFDLNKKNDLIKSSFNKSYKLDFKDLNYKDDLLNKNIGIITYLLFGKEKESSEEYYFRRKEFLNYLYFSDNKDPNSKEYKYNLFARISEDSFNLIQNKNIIISSINNIKINNINDNLFKVSILLPDVLIDSEEFDNPKNIIRTRKNILLDYYFIKNNNKYKLIYFDLLIKNNINRDYSFAIKNSYLNELYDFNDLTNLTNINISNNQIFILSSNNINKVISKKLGVLVSNGIILTNYSFLEENFQNNGLINVVDLNNNLYKIDGIVFADREKDVVLLKLDQDIKFSSKFAFDSKFQEGVYGINLDDFVKFNKTIIINKNNNYIDVFNKNNLLLFNKDNHLLAIKTKNEYLLINNLQSIVNLINNNIDVLKLEDFKKNFYNNKITKLNKVKIKNNNKFINEIVNNVNFDLVSFQYNKGVYSLRFENTVNKFLSNDISNVQLINYFEKNNYNKIYYSDNRTVLKNKNKEVIILNKFNYIIVVIKNV